MVLSSYLGENVLLGPTRILVFLLVFVMSFDICVSPTEKAFHVVLQHSCSSCQHDTFLINKETDMTKLTLHCMCDDVFVL